MLPLLVTHGVMQGRISWSRLAELTSANPARIFGLRRKGVLAPGYDADVVIYDPQIEGIASGRNDCTTWRATPPTKAGPFGGPCETSFAGGEDWSEMASSCLRLAGDSSSPPAPRTEWGLHDASHLQDRRTQATMIPVLSNSLPERW